MSYTPTQSRSITRSATRSPKRLPPTQPTTTVVIGPGPPGAAPTYVGYDPEHPRRSEVVTIPRSVEGEEHEEPVPQMRTGPHIGQWLIPLLEITCLQPSSTTKPGH